MDPITKKKPTHVVVVEIPLHIEEGQTFPAGPFREALRVVLALVRLGTVQLLCDDPNVSIRER